MLLLVVLPVIVRLCLRLRLSMPLRLYPYLYPYPWGWMGWDDEYRRGAYRSRPSASAQRVDGKAVGSTNVDCLLLYRPRLVRDQTPNTRRPGSQEACQKGSIHTTHHLKSMLLASKRVPY